ncbi:hypothetical protein Tco_0217911 [Tanacetum coccineum]
MKNQRTTLWWFKTTRIPCGADTNHLHLVGLDYSCGSGVEIGEGCGVRGEAVVLMMMMVTSCVDGDEHGVMWMVASVALAGGGRRYLKVRVDESGSDGDVSGGSGRKRNLSSGDELARVVW